MYYPLFLILGRGGVKRKPVEPGPVPEPVDKEALITAIDNAGNLNESDYTAGSWAALSSSLIAGQATVDNVDATEQDVADALSSINDAVNDLVNITALQSAVQAAAGLEESDYTPETWAPFSAALSDGQTALGNANATQQAVDDAATALSVAQSNLEPV